MRRSAATSTARRGLPFLCIVVLLAAACFRGDTVERYLAERIPFATTRFETDLIFPSPASGRYLATNWAPEHTWSTGTVYPEGTSATIRFFSVSDVPPTFVAEAMRVHADSPPQRMTLLMNGQSVATETLGSEWETYEAALPASALHVGWNELELRFTTTVPWPANQPGNLDPPPRAARFRKIEMRSGLGRPYHPERPAAVALADLDGRSASLGATAAIPIELAPDRFEDFSAAAIDMAADSLMELYLLPAPETRLAGEVAADGISRGMKVVVEIVDHNGPTRVFEASLAADEARSVDADLGPWRDELVRLRVRVFGAANGTVRWTGLRTVSEAEPPDAPDRPDLRFLLDPIGAAEQYGPAMRPDALVAPPRSGSLERPDIFLIILDAARADRFEGTLGDELSPHIRALAAEGTAFSRAWAPSSWTGQSIPALLAGLYPDAIGIENWASRLSTETITFPELLAAAGYHTALWSQHPIYSRRPELRGGFEVYENAAAMATQDPATLPDLSALLEEGRPTLAMIHLLPPHTPYTPPAPFAGSRSSWYDGKVPINDETLNQFDLRFSLEQPALRDEIRRAAIARYEENVSFADHLVGRLVDDLRRAGRYDDALIIVTADHGEAFYEHHRFLHNHLLFEEFIRVPLVIKWPDSLASSAGLVAEPVSLVDLAPSLVDGLGLSDESVRFQGRSLLPIVSGRETGPRLLYAYTSGVQRPESPPQPHYALLWNDLKLIHVGRTDRSELYRLSDDPGERADIADQETSYVRWLSQLLRSVQAHNAGLTMEAGGTVTEELDPETIRRLRALGYLR